jgi:divalent metal cation (Fe/Co/Zn/Cd) transporter
LKVRFARGMDVEQIEAVTNDLEARIRAAHPEFERIFVEADGRYDARRDPAVDPADIGDRPG